MKIAPTLTGFISRLAYRNENERIYHARLLAQTRALLAVARAAGPFMWHAIGDTEQCFGECDKADRLQRALARLEKVSKP
jgi:hypothetical protein